MSANAGSVRAKTRAESKHGARFAANPLVGKLLGELRDALDMTKAPSKVRRWSDMTPDERAAIEASLKP